MGDWDPGQTRQKQQDSVSGCAENAAAYIQQDSLLIRAALFLQPARPKALVGKKRIDKHLDSLDVLGVCITWVCWLKQKLGYGGDRNV